MRILVCGSRHWTDDSLIRRVLSFCRQAFGEFTLIHGNARGADKIAGHISSEEMEFITVAVPAQWKRFRLAAGPRRNTRMLEQGKPHLVVAFHEDVESSKGTWDMVLQARQVGVPVIIVGLTPNLEDVRKQILGVVSSRSDKHSAT